MAHLRMLTPEASPEPETRPSGLWQAKPTTTNTNTNTATTQHQHQPQPSPLPKRKRSWPFTTTRPVSPPTSNSPMRDDEDDRPTSPSTSTSTSTSSVKALWENNVGGFRTAAKRGQQAPFQDANHDEDLQPIFETQLIGAGIDDVTSPEYTLAFYPRAHELALHAENALLHHGDRALAAALYLRACAVLRVGRWSPAVAPPPPPHAPSSSHSSAAQESGEEETAAIPPCPVRARAWHLQKSYHTKAGRLQESPLDEVTIPHTHDAATKPGETNITTAGVRDRGSIAAAAATRAKAGPSRPQIPLVVRLPQRTLRTGNPCPAVLVVTSDRTAHSALCGDLLARGWGCVVVEAPGFGDCPVPGPAVATTPDAEAPPALWASVLDWMGAIRVFDMARVVVWADAAVGASGGLVGQFAAAAVGGSSPVRGFVAVVPSGGGESAVTGMVAGSRLSSGGRVLVVADNNNSDAAGAEAACNAGDDGGLVLFEYGAHHGVGAEQAVVRSLAAGAAAVYDWVEDLLRMDSVV